MATCVICFVWVVLQQFHLHLADCCCPRKTFFLTAFCHHFHHCEIEIVYLKFGPPKKNFIERPKCQWCHKTVMKIMSTSWAKETVFDSTCNSVAFFFPSVTYHSTLSLFGFFLAYYYRPVCDISLLSVLLWPCYLV